MPDVWTFNPPKLREALKLSGARCGVEPRVLKPRDPEWTCHVNGVPYSYDIYIHHSSELLTSDIALSLLVLTAVAGIFVGLFWGRFFNRSVQPPA